MKTRAKLIICIFIFALSNLACVDLVDTAVNGAADTLSESIEHEVGKLDADDDCDEWIEGFLLQKDGCHR